MPSAVERLEVRSLLSTAAVISYRMVPQIYPDIAHGNQPDLPDTSSYVNPPGGYPLTLNATGTKGINEGTTYAWKVTGKGISETLTGVGPELSLPQGSYKVTLKVSGLTGHSKPVTASTTIQVKDVLVVSIGDSYASGEGDPVVPGLLTYVPAQWAYSPDPAIDQQNADAHRSTISGPAEFALQLQEANPHEAVTFVSVANSGASIKTGILNPMTSVGDPSVQLPSEISELKQIIGKRKIDVLTISEGGNDVGFIPLLANLIANNATQGQIPTVSSIRSQLTAALKDLPGQFANLDKAIKKLDPGRVIASDYPDLTHDQTGNPAAILSPYGTTLISQADSQLASAEFLTPLDDAIASFAKEYHWTFADIRAAFNTHGYPSTDSFIVNLAQSLEQEGSTSGAFHPNATGEAAIASVLLAAYDGKSK